MVGMYIREGSNGMRDRYKIGEISKLYGIGSDSLRYYEKIGALHPRRDANNYRLYSLTDIYRLSIIRDLLGLNFSMMQIKQYLDDQTLNTTDELLRCEEAAVEEKLRRLTEQKSILQKRRQELERDRLIPSGRFVICSLPERRCVQLNEHITRDEEMDFVIKKLHRKYEDQLRSFGTQTIGACFSMPDWARGISNVYQSVFFVLDNADTDCDFVLPSGDYLTYAYRGPYEQNGQRLHEALAYLRENGYFLRGNPFEIYKIDNRDTSQPEEFLTEIQIPVSAANNGNSHQ